MHSASSDEFSRYNRILTHNCTQAAGIKLGPRGDIETNKSTTQCIGQPHIYAAGDATLDIGLVSVAELEGRVAVEHMFGCKVRDPSCIIIRLPASYTWFDGVLYIIISHLL